MEGINTMFQWLSGPVLNKYLTPLLSGAGVKGAMLLFVVGAAWPWAGIQAQTPPEKEKVAVLDLEVVGASAAEGASVTERVRSEMFATGLYTMVSRNLTNQVLDEQALQQTLCMDDACAARVGKILGVGTIITGRLSRPNANLWQVSLQITAVETAETLAVKTITHTGDLSTLLNREMPALVAALTGKRGLKPPPRGRALAVLPPKYSGKRVGMAQSKAKVLLENVASTLENVLQGELKYSFESVNGSRRFENLRRVKKNSWDEGGMFSAVQPNTEFVFKLGNKLGVDWLLMYHIQYERSKKMTLWLLNPKNKQVLQIEKEWEAGELGPDLIQGVVALRSQMQKPEDR